MASSRASHRAIPRSGWVSCLFEKVPMPGTRNWGHALLWRRISFLRCPCSHATGPYAPAVLRFQISFPHNYPALPPLVTFSTDVFHPLLTPLTTYTYTTGSSDTDTVSATDEERLPPGGFSLRHGFPQWFGRARKSAASSRDVSGSSICSASQGGTPRPARSREDEVRSLQLASSTAISGKGVTIVKVLDYIRSTFSEEAVLDSIPLEAAANPGAYHAWRSYRSESLQAQKLPSSPSSSTNSPPRLAADGKGDSAALGRNRRPGDWNWEGVWEERVRKTVKASLSESVLYGGGVPGEDIVRSKKVRFPQFLTKGRYDFGTAMRKHSKT